MTERESSNNKKRTFVSYGCPNRKRIDEDKCKNESITVLQLQKVILHLLKKEFLLSDIQMKKLTDLIERLEKYKRTDRENTKRAAKSVENIDRKISFCYMEYRSGSTSQTQFLEIKKKLERKKGTKSAAFAGVISKICFG